MRMTTSRPGQGMLLPEDDPRVKAAFKAVKPIVNTTRHGGRYGDAWDWRDVAEIVNAVLAADDEIHNRPIDWSRSSFDLPDAPTEGA